VERGSSNAAIDPEDPYSLMLTSGSTGAPKVVVLSRRAVLASAFASETQPRA
jgi:long-subunit acyl-CoA synthetase (AMP-forming)